MTRHGGSSVERTCGVAHARAAVKIRITFRAAVMARRLVVGWACGSAGVRGAARHGGGTRTAAVQIHHRDHPPERLR